MSTRVDPRVTPTSTMQIQAPGLTQIKPVQHNEVPCKLIRQGGSTKKRGPAIFGTVYFQSIYVVVWLQCVRKSYYIMDYS